MRIEILNNNINLYKAFKLFPKSLYANNDMFHRLLVINDGQQKLLVFHMHFDEMNFNEELYTSEYPLEWGTIPKNEHDYLIFKMGEDIDPLIMDHPFEPRDDIELFDQLVRARQIVIIATEGQQGYPYIRVMRICPIGMLDQLYLAERYHDLIVNRPDEQLKYLDYVQSLQHSEPDPLKRWERATKFTRIE